MADKDKTLPKFQNTSQNPKHIPESKNTSRIQKDFPESKTHPWIWILGRVFGFWEVFCRYEPP